MGWHGGEARLRRDPTSCDYGVGFFGTALHIGAFLVQVEGETAPRCYLCNLHANATGGGLVLIPVDPFRARVYIAPIGLDLEAEAGSFRALTVDLASQRLVVTFDTVADPNRALPSSARLRLTTPASAFLHRSVSEFVVRDAATAKVLALERGAYELPLQADKKVAISITWP